MNTIMQAGVDRNALIALLLGKDLRTVRQNKIVIAFVKSQNSFDELFGLIFHHERVLVMRAIDAVEKITHEDPSYLQPHKLQLLHVLKSADHKELKWHIAQLVSRINLTSDELKDVWHILDYWARNMNEGKITRVNALQGLFDLSLAHPELKGDLIKTIGALAHEKIPSLQARIRRLKNQI